MRAVLIDALEKQYEADIAAGDAAIKLLLENSVAVSEHLNHQKELDCQLHKIASAEEKLQVLKDYEIPVRRKMPFKSEKQRRYLWKNEPKIAREWTKAYGSKPKGKKKKTKRRKK